MVTYLSHRLRKNNKQSCNTARIPTKRKASTRKVIAADARPRTNRYGRRQILLQSEQAWHFTSYQRYATLEPDRLGRMTRMDLKSDLLRSVEVMWTTVDIYHK